MFVGEKVVRVAEGPGVRSTDQGQGPAHAVQNGDGVSTKAQTT